MSHVFDEALRLVADPGDPGDPHVLHGHTHPAYANMVGPFGGITAALLLQAALQHPAREGEPIALTVNYAAPVAAGALQVHARPLRTNRSTQHWQLSITQGEGQGQLCASGSAVFAQRRHTWSAPEARPPAGLPPPQALPRHDGAGLPTWVQAYDMRFPDGEGPFSSDGREQAHSESRLWIRDEPPRPLDFPALAALSDAFFPRIYVRRRRPTPAGTITLSTYFHADGALLAAQGTRHVLGTARALNFRHGYFDQSAEVWSHTGELLASTHQMVYFRE